MRKQSPAYVLPLAVVLLAVSPSWADDAPAAPRTFEVESVKDVAYYDSDGADPVKHKLDLYLPKGLKDYPVLFFVHGGAWVSGDKKMYAPIGRVLASHGIGAVVTNYRLSPRVKHPAHIEDVARAFAWTHGHIGGHGGRADQIFCCGHSAGGHLVALLATDESYLKAEKLTLAHIKGVIPMSGVYQIPPLLFASIFGFHQQPFFLRFQCFLKTVNIVERSFALLLKLFERLFRLLFFARQF